MYVDKASAAAFNLEIVCLPVVGLSILIGWSIGVYVMSKVFPDDLAIRVCCSPGSYIAFFVAYFDGDEVPSAIAETAWNTAQSFMIEQAQERNDAGTPTIVILQED